MATLIAGIIIGYGLGLVSWAVAAAVDAEQLGIDDERERY